jgi:VWFA-related protein
LAEKGSSEMAQRLILKQLVLCCTIAFSAYLAAQSVDTIVTVQRKAGNTDAIQGENVLVFEGGKRAPITVWKPFTGSNAALQLLILIDDSSAGGLSNQLNDIRTFIQKLPDTTQVGVGYMLNGGATMAQNFTKDHELAAKSLRMPQSIRGGGSPYFTMSQVAKQWPSEGTSGRREVLMITDGVDRYGGVAFNSNNPNVSAAIRDAQRANIVVFSIYWRGAGALDADPAVVSSGQNYLSQLTTDTGGKSLYWGTGNPVSVVPFLEELNGILVNQYELGFKAHAKPQYGLVSLRLKMETPGIKLIYPAMVPVSQ